MNKTHPSRSSLCAAALALVTATATTARAQEPASAPTETPAPTETATPAPEAKPAEAAAEAPPAEAPAGEAPAPNAAVDEKLTELHSRIEGMGEPMSALQTDVANLKRLKFSGYIQGRYDWHDDANYGVDISKTPNQRGTNRFHVRRARLKTTYVGDFSEYMLQFDATPDGVVVRDAEASLVLTNENPWMPSATPWELKLTIGQFKIPFGFEVLQSSGDREMPERTDMVRALYPGERDRGLRLQYTYDWFKLQAAVINGTFTNDSHVGSYEHTSWKDVVGRLGVDLDFLVVGVSAHHGHFLQTNPLARAATTAMPVPGYRRFSRLRLGADAQLFFDELPFGGTTLRAETIWSKDKQLAFAGDPPASTCLDQSRFGYYVTLVQNLGDSFGIAARFDNYDPTSSIEGTCADRTLLTTAENDSKNNIGAALLWYISGNLKASLAYNHFGEQEASKRDNDEVIFQLQAKF